MLLLLHVQKKLCDTKEIWEERRELSCVLLLSAVDKRIPLHSCIFRCVDATLHFKWVFRLFDRNSSTVKCLISDPEGTDRTDTLQFVVKQLSPSLHEDFNIL